MALLVENTAELILNVDKMELSSQVSSTLTDDDRLRCRSLKTAAGYTLHSCSHKSEETEPRGEVCLQV